ncbi:AraC family transcriptional regulator [Veronia nyctiphanis]|uniref:AraC family transcriptional regulator n=1 Tax=Veronia nyctiphanis TaxID=1278244 RepID=A0A4Q0YVU6_9GAMM|nr:AraC family transcriptional regulator [Veronia nyctiphanis]RXJ74935.1 AraC family transcriptional regulator [Veronia nyctiphanis]
MELVTHEIDKEPVWEFIQIEEESICYYEHGLPDRRIHWHVHEHYELHLITDTQGKVTIGNYLAPFAPGHLSLVGPWLPHNWISQLEPDEHRAKRDMVIQFKPDLFPMAARIFPELEKFAEMLERAKMGLEFLNVPLIESERRFAQIRDSQGVERLMHFLSLINYINKAENRVLSTIPASEVRDASTLQNRVSVVIDYVMTKHQQPIRLKDVASLLNMTDSYFSRFFHQSTGHRFTDFVNRVRVQRACVMLAETAEAVATISQTVGFQNLANFSRQFRRIKGVSPLAYRKKHKGF